MECIITRSVSPLHESVSFYGLLQALSIPVTEWTLHAVSACSEIKNYARIILNSIACKVFIFSPEIRCINVCWTTEYVLKLISQ